MNHLREFAAGTVALMLGSLATAVRAQTAPSPLNSVVLIEADDAMDLQLAKQISEAWTQGKDVTAAVAFQVKGENALSQGDPLEASRYFEAAEHELTVLRPIPLGAPSASE